MWRHGIHSFFELLRHQLPDSLDHMLSFAYLACSMMALLMQTVPSFEETWIRCLGDLARYRMAIEEADLKDGEVHGKAAGKLPQVDRCSTNRTSRYVAYKHHDNSETRA